MRSSCGPREQTKGGEDGGAGSGRLIWEPLGWEGREKTLSSPGSEEVTVAWMEHLTARTSVPPPNQVEG